MDREGVSAEMKKTLRKRETDVGKVCHPIKLLITQMGKKSHLELWAKPCFVSYFSCLRVYKVPYTV